MNPVILAAVPVFLRLSCTPLHCDPFDIWRDQSTRFARLLMVGVGPRNHRRVSGDPKLGKDERLAHHSGRVPLWSVDAEGKQQEPLCKSSNLEKGLPSNSFGCAIFPSEQDFTKALSRTNNYDSKYNRAEIDSRKCPC